MNNIELFQKVNSLMMAMYHLRKNLSNFDKPNSPDEVSHHSVLSCPKYSVNISHSGYETEVIVRSVCGLKNHDMIACSVRGEAPEYDLIRYDNATDVDRVKIFVTAHPSADAKVIIRHNRSAENPTTSCTYSDTEETLFQKSTVQNVPDIEELKTIQSIAKLYDFLPKGTYTRTSLHSKLVSDLNSVKMGKIENTVWEMVNIFTGGEFES